MLRMVTASIAPDPEMPMRSTVLDIRRRVLAGTVYDLLPHSFHEERLEDGKYVPLALRQPSVQCGIPRIVVDDTATLLFGEGRFPRVVATPASDATAELITAMLEATDLQGKMLEAMRCGAVGSVAIRLRILEGRPFVDVMRTECLTPAYLPNRPDTLASVTERYKLTGTELAAAGWDIAPDRLAELHWFQRTWTDAEEVWFVPLPCSMARDGAQPQRDGVRTVRHDLGFVPIVWVRNLPGGDEIDGAPTVPREAVETSIEIDYQLSQAGRGLRYSSDPTLLIKEPAAASDEGMTRSPGDAIVVSEKGDAKLLEIGGTASAAVVDYCRHLRDVALEAAHGDRSSPDKLATAQSGRAMELLKAPLIGVADMLRQSYGNRGILALVRMIARASQTVPLTLGEDVTGARFPAGVRYSLAWGPWFSPTHQDRASEAALFKVHRENGAMSQQTVVEKVAETEQVADAEAELARIKADEAAAIVRANAMPGAQERLGGSQPG